MHLLLRALLLWVFNSVGFLTVLYHGEWRGVVKLVWCAVLCAIWFVLVFEILNCAGRMSFLLRKIVMVANCFFHPESKTLKNRLFLIVRRSTGVEVCTTKMNMPRARDAEYGVLTKAGACQDRCCQLFFDMISDDLCVYEKT